MRVPLHIVSLGQRGKNGAEFPQFGRENPYFAASRAPECALHLTYLESLRARARLASVNTFRVICGATALASHPGGALGVLRWAASRVRELSPSPSYS